MKNVELRKEMVKRAKMRMVSGDYEAVAADERIFCSEEAQPDEKLLRYVEIVREIKSSPTFVCDPLRRMMDEEFYASLSDGERMGYLLDLSKIYKEISEKIQKS